MSVRAGSMIGLRYEKAGAGAGAETGSLEGKEYDAGGRKDNDIPARPREQKQPRREKHTPDHHRRQSSLRDRLIPILLELLEVVLVVEHVCDAADYDADEQCEER